MPPSIPHEHGHCIITSCRPKKNPNITYALQPNPTNESLMCVHHVVTYHGCGCNVPGTYFCEPARQAARDSFAHVVACADISLPDAEIERDHACFRPECPKKIKFEPWRCCACGEGPNDTTICKFEIEEIPEYLKDFQDLEGIKLCNHNLCMKCPKFRERRSCVEDKNKKRRSTMD